jgi:hypothetical protein
VLAGYQQFEREQEVEEGEEERQQPLQAAGGCLEKKEEKRRLRVEEGDCLGEVRRH